MSPAALTVITVVASIVTVVAGIVAVISAGRWGHLDAVPNSDMTDRKRRSLRRARTSTYTSFAVVMVAGLVATIASSV